MKMLKITGCPDKLMWYASLIGTEQAYIKTIHSEQVYLSRDLGGYLNIIRMTDAVIVGV